MAIKMSAAHSYPAEIDLSPYEEHLLKRKLTKDEAKIVVQVIGDHIDCYMDEPVYENSGAVELMKVLAAVHSVLNRSSTPKETKMILEAYYTFLDMPSAKIIEKISDIARTWME